jgi:hypothetical protein
MTISETTAPPAAATVSVTEAARIMGVSEPTARRMFDACAPESGTKTSQGGPTGVGERRVNLEWARRKANERVIAKLSRMEHLRSVLGDLAAMDVASLASALAGEAGGVDAYRRQVEEFRDLASKTVAVLVEAQALAPQQHPGSGQPVKE